MTLKSMIAADQHIFCNPDELGENVLYTPAGGVEKAICIGFKIENLMPEFEAEGEDRTLNAIAKVPRSEISAPGIGDTLIHNDIHFTATSIVNSNHAAVKLNFVSKNRYRTGGLKAQ